MPQWQNGREREKRKETENKEGRERGGQHRVSLSIFAAGEEKAKNTPPAFFPPREGVRREERARDRKAKKKKRAFPSSVPPPSPASGCPVLPFPRFFFFFLTAETRVGSCVIHVGCSTLFGSAEV